MNCTVTQCASCGTWSRIHIPSPTSSAPSTRPHNHPFLHNSLKDGSTEISCITVGPLPLSQFNVKLFYLYSRNQRGKSQFLEWAGARKKKTKYQHLEVSLTREATSPWTCSSCPQISERASTEIPLSLKKHQICALKPGLFSFLQYKVEAEGST